MKEAKDMQSATVAPSLEHPARPQTGRGEPLPGDRSGNISHPFQPQAVSLRHNLSDHPLFRLSNLAELAGTLPPALSSTTPEKIPVSLPDWENTPYTGLSAEETVRRIEECGSWMVLKRAEADPDCLDVLNRCLDEIEPLSERSSRACASAKRRSS